MDWTETVYIRERVILEIDQKYGSDFYQLKVSFGITFNEISMLVRQKSIYFVFFGFQKVSPSISFVAISLPSHRSMLVFKAFTALLWSLCIQHCIISHQARFFESCCVCIRGRFSLFEFCKYFEMLVVMAFIDKLASILCSAQTFFWAFSEIVCKRIKEA